MSEKKEVSRAELVRLRREQEHNQSMHRIAKEATRPVAVRAKKKAAAPKAKVSKPKESTRRRFQIALPAAPRVNVRSISVSRPRSSQGGPKNSLSFVRGMSAVP